ncbi:hypothetical protein HOO68_06815 [Candidatus Gracilibacteria bacterium]|nr:hypothetical protein [Candidatus Gracilibacteria bacterium]
MFNKILHLLLIIVFLFGNIVYCSAEDTMENHDDHSIHTEESHNCCPTQHPVSKGNQITGIVEQKEIKKQEKIHILVSFTNNIISPFLAYEEIIEISEHRDRQHYFFTDTIRLIV